MIIACLIGGGLVVAGDLVLVGGHLGRSQARWEVLNAERSTIYEAEEKQHVQTETKHSLAG
jgi:thiamine monophosphate kinase